MATIGHMERLMPTIQMSRHDATNHSRYILIILSIFGRLPNSFAVQKNFRYFSQNEAIQIHI